MESSSRTQPMSDEQSAFLSMLQDSTVAIESSEVIGDVLVVKLKPNLLCVVERNGASNISTRRRE